MPCPSFRSVALALGLLLGGAAIAPAEIEKSLKLCPGGLCGPTYRAKITPPPGWARDESVGAAEGMVVLKPAAPSGAVEIYAEAQLDRSGRDFESAMARQIAIWRKRDPATTLTRTGEVARRDGQPPFALHAFRDADPEAPSVGRVAWGADTDRDGNRYLVVVVLMSPGDTLPAEAEAAYLSVLRTW